MYVNFVTNALDNRLTVECKKKKLIHCSQTTDNTFSLKTLINKYTRGVRNGKVYSCFIDLEKAYDSVWHEGMHVKFESLSINGSIKNMYENLTVQLKYKIKLLTFRVQ